jgi:hypothetical protein
MAMAIGLVICLSPYAASAYSIAQVAQFINDSKQQYPNCRIYSETYTLDSWTGYRVYKDCKDSIVYSRKRYDVTYEEAYKCITYCGWLELYRCSGPESPAVLGHINVNEIYYGPSKSQIYNTYCSGRTAMYEEAGGAYPMNNQKCLIAVSIYPDACKNAVDLLKDFYPVCVIDDGCCGSKDLCCGKPDCCSLGQGGSSGSGGPSNGGYGSGSGGPNYGPSRSAN